MSTSTIIWIVVAVVVVVVVIAILAAVLGKSRKTKRRSKAGELRQQAAAHAPDVHRSAGNAQQAETDAHRKRQEAEHKRAEAEHAERRAEEARRGQVAAEATVEDRVREADRLDPDVDDRSGGYTPDTRAVQPGTSDPTHRGPVQGEQPPRP